MLMLNVLRKSAIGAAVALSAFAAHAADAYYQFDYSAVSAFNPSPYGTIKLSENLTGGVDFTVTLKTGLEFVNTGLGYLFAFNTAAGSNITTNSIQNVLFNGIARPGVTLVGTPGSNGNVGQFSLGLDCTGAAAACPTGGSSPGFFNDPLTFTVAGATLNTFAVKSSRGYYFAADVILVPGGATGAIGATQPGVPRIPQELPEPGSLALVGLALAGVGFARRIAKK